MTSDIPEPGLSGSVPEAPVDTAPMAAPVAESERIASIDTLRGFALLGILVMNIPFFALPSAVMFKPDLIGGFEGLDFLAWGFGELFFNLKFMALFSMLFGAGLILLVTRLEESGRPARRIYYRRIGWLFVIGLIHAYGLWYGDILVPYAVCGLLIYLFRKLSVRWLLIVGTTLILFGVLPSIGMGKFMYFTRGQAELAAAAGDEATADQQHWARVWRGMGGSFEAGEEAVERVVDIHKGNYFDIFIYRLPEVVQMQTFGFFFFYGWRVLGLMLVGMGLLRARFFSAERSRRLYITTAIVGYGLGLPIVYYGIVQVMANDFDIPYFFAEGSLYNYVGSLGVAIGHASVIMLICKLGVLTWLRRRLAAVGRMALTNYLSHTIICTSIFYGYGFGLFGDLNRSALLGIVLAVWIFQLTVNPIWLKHFRFGPAEWLWRSLTYRRAQPMRVRAG